MDYHCPWLPAISNATTAVGFLLRCFNASETCGELCHCYIPHYNNHRSSSLYVALYIFIKHTLCLMHIWNGWGLQKHHSTPNINTCIFPHSILTVILPASRSFACTQCPPCPKGQQALQPGSGNCSLCPPGELNSLPSLPCLFSVSLLCMTFTLSCVLASCVPGTCKPKEDTSQCQSCRPGFYMPAYGATECNMCKAKYFCPVSKWHLSHCSCLLKILLFSIIYDKTSIDWKE